MLASMRLEPDSPEIEKSFRHKKSLGQNFLTSDIVPNWLCEAGALVPGETVLEIGPGTGRLTSALLKREVNVIAVEADSRAIESLEKTFASAINTGQLTIHHGDSRLITPKELGLSDHSFKVVANIPYYLSGILLRGLLESETQPKTLVFLMQKELVARIARAEKESLLSLSIKAFGEPKYVKTVARGHFFPIPNVDSAILAINNINRDNFTSLRPEFFFDLLHLGLGKKRKQLLTNLTPTWDRSTLEVVFAELGLGLKIRGEDIDLPTWLTLAQILESKPNELLKKGT